MRTSVILRYYKHSITDRAAQGPGRVTFTVECGVVSSNTFVVAPKSTYQAHCSVVGKTTRRFSLAVSSITIRSLSLNSAPSFVEAVLVFNV